MYSTVFSSPPVPGLRPSNSSDASAATCARKTSTSSQGICAASFAWLATPTIVTQPTTSHSERLRMLAFPLSFSNFLQRARPIEPGDQYHAGPQRADRPAPPLKLTQAAGEAGPRHCCQPGEYRGALQQRSKLAPQLRFIP